MQRRRTAPGRGRNRVRNLLAFGVFVLLIGAGGYALSAADFIDNPFEQMAFLSNWASGGERQFEQSFATTAADSAATGEFALPDLSTSNSLGDAAADADTSVSSPSAAEALEAKGDDDLALASLNVGDSQFALPTLDSDSAATADDAPALSRPDGAVRGGDDAIQWDSVGDVLFNVWFIGAVTALFIVVQQVLKFTFKQFKRRPQPAAVIH